MPDLVDLSEREVSERVKVDLYSDIDPWESTDFLPGTYEKLRVLCARNRAGAPLFQVGDRVAYNNLSLDEVLGKSPLVGIFFTRDNRRPAHRRSLG